MARSSAPNPFGAARRITPAASASKSAVLLATAVVNAQGQEVFSVQQTKDALTNFVQGAREAAAAKNLMEGSRPIIESLGTYLFARDWHGTRKRPDNPKISADPGAATVNFIVQDRMINVSDDEAARIQTFMGDHFEGAVVSKEVFTLDSDVLDQELTVKVKDSKGKQVEKKDTVMNHVANALQGYFADHPDLLASLFTVKPVQQTAKGLIDRGLEVANSPHRLVEFMDTIKAAIQVKPVGV
jgi:hypothetical protein